jgi:glyoxylase-like metal-dependent hydrolase (beta-lactamase superfamily II)
MVPAAVPERRAVNFIFEQIRTGGDRNFAYLIGDRTAGVAAAVDPSYNPERTLVRARAQGLTITHILNTHGHQDHVNGNSEMARLTGALIGAHPRAPETPGLALEDGDEFSVGSIPIRILHVPGHYPDHLLFHLPDQAMVITGDLLFVGKIGGTGSDLDTRTEFESLRRMLRDLPDETTVWPGHDYGCRPSSTIGLERRNNPFLQAPDLESFLTLKEEWAGFKATNGLL